MSTAAPHASEIAVGQELPPFELALTPTMVVAGAIASRDFMPAHHDPAFAKAQGAPNIFLNILTTNGYVSRYVTDWAGPEAMLRSIKIRLGAPAIPGLALRFSGEVLRKQEAGGECVVEVSVRAANDLGDHATGTVELTLPLRSLGDVR
jgi:acyl dehydratase